MSGNHQPNQIEMYDDDEYSSDGQHFRRHQSKDCSSSKNEFIHQFNSKNAKIIACCIVFGFVLYHTILRLTHGLDSCKWLLSDGNFRDQVWQPYGCMMHHYSHTDSRRCLRYTDYWGGKNNFLFIGDSRTEQLYHTFIHQISPSYESPKKSHAPLKSDVDFSSRRIEEDLFQPSNLINQDMVYNDSELGLKIQFLWHPYPNKSLISVLQQWKTGAQDIPSVIVISSGGPLSSDPLDPNVLEDYTASLTHLVLNIDRLAEQGTRILWALQEPVDSEKLDAQRLVITNEKVDTFNEQSIKVLRYSKADIWSSGRLVAAQNLHESIDGYHLGSKTLFQQSQILLNMYCNDNMNYNDATCCSSSESISNLQIVTFSIFGISFLLACFAFIRQHWCNSRRRFKHVAYKRLDGDICNCDEDKSLTESWEYYNALMALAKLAVIMSFFLICDRTTMFMKENKYFTQTNFWLPVVYILVLGIFFTEDSGYTKVLHYDQDNETKGWMVLLILVYNMMGASQVLPIFMFVKILYSAFLFLHGWNQFLNYTLRGDFSAVKCLQELFRLNIMTVLLCLCMNRPYQFYEFIPLISFWTLVVYISLSIPPRITWAACEANSLNYLYLVFKVVGIILFATVLYMSEVFFEKVFVTRPWKALFVTPDDDIHDWWTRWKIDRYSLPCGMVLAFLSHIARRYKILEDDNHGNLFSTRISLSAILFSVTGIGGYCAFSVLCRNQLECLEIHSYVGFLPVASYILLRNVSGMLRTRFSSFFAWFGQFWVELLVGQYHIWMGADGHGVLVLVPAYPVGNVLLTAFVFACTAHEVHKCTNALIHCAVPEDWRKALRNVIIFFLILVPIGISDGMF